MNRLKAALVRQAVWVRPFRTILYLTPAFTVSAAELSHLCRSIHAVLADGEHLQPPVRISAG